MKSRYLSILLSTLITFGYAAENGVEPYENLVIKKITVNIENQAPGDVNESQAIVLKMQTKKGAPFNQETFDKDLKRLSDEYEWVEPRIKVENREAIITLDIQKRPVITRFEVQGSTYSKKKILSEGELTHGMKYNRENFYKSIHKIREFLNKKGFYKAEVSYTIEQIPRSTEITVVIRVDQGPKGHINKIIFRGFTKAEEKQAMALIRARKFNFLYSWLTGSGIIKQGEMDPDVQTLVNHFHNQGYVDAHVSMVIEEIPGNKLALVIALNRGEKYHFRNVNFAGETIIAEASLRKAAKIKTGDVFSIDKIRNTQEVLKDLYAKDGFLHTNVDYSLNLNAYEHTYDITFNVEESKQYRVGLVLVSGNFATTKNVVYNNIDLEPGEVFNSSKIKSTQNRLRSTGYFDNVNVYPVKCEERGPNAPEYCDVMVEVNEAKTGNASLFVGLSSTDSIFGGVELTENNFNIGGIKNLFTRGPCCLRGAGQFFQLKGQIGAKESEVGFTWMDPYYNDTLWRVGMDLNYQVNSIMSPNYRFRTLSGSVSARYPLSPYLTYGVRARAKNSNITIIPTPREDIENAAEIPPSERKPIIIAPTDKQNSGFVTGVALLLGYDSTDNALRPRSGIRSGVEAEFAGLVRRVETLNDFPFLKFGYLNSLYYPVWSKGILKLRGDFKCIQPLFEGDPRDLPLSERFFLGGEGTVRGYSPGKIGPFFNENPQDPTGGVTSALLSVEYSQKIARPLDIFVFFDSGSISLEPWKLEKFQSSVGVGARIDIGKALPFVVGYGWPLGNQDEKVVQNVFFSMAGQF